MRFDPQLQLLQAHLLDTQADHLSYLPEVVGPQHLHARALQFIGVAPLRHPHLDLDDERYRVADVLHWLGPQRFHGVLRMGSAALMEFLCHRPFRPHCLADLGIFWSSDAWIPLAPQFWKL